MILMANGYVGFKILEYLTGIDENIDFFVYTEKGDPSYNKMMFDLINNLCNDTIVIDYDGFVLKHQFIRERKIEFGVLAWWPIIVSKAVIQTTVYGFINTHPSFLPFNRGKHPYFWAIVNENKYGVTLHWIDERVDAGRVIIQEEIKIDWEDTGESVYVRARETMVSLFTRAYMVIKNDIDLGRVDRIGSENIIENECVRHANEIDTISCINLDKKYYAKDLLNIIRGRMFNEKGEAFFDVDGVKYYLSLRIEREEGKA